MEPKPVDEVITSELSDPSSTSHFLSLSLLFSNMKLTRLEVWIEIQSALSSNTTIIHVLGYLPRPKISMQIILSMTVILSYHPMQTANHSPIVLPSTLPRIISM
jgi:hypothetical protein